MARTIALLAVLPALALTACGAHGEAPIPASACEPVIFEDTPFTLTIVADAAFARYLREATDFAGGRRIDAAP